MAPSCRWPKECSKQQSTSCVAVRPWAAIRPLPTCGACSSDT